MSPYSSALNLVVTKNIVHWYVFIKFARLIMAALHSRCGHCILQLWFVSFFLTYSQWSQIGCLPYFYTCG